MHKLLRYAKNVLRYAVIITLCGNYYVMRRHMHAPEQYFVQTSAANLFETTFKYTVQQLLKLNLYVLPSALSQPSTTTATITTTTAKAQTTTTTTMTTTTTTEATTPNNQPTGGFTPGSTFNHSGHLSNSSEMTSIKMTTVPSHDDPSTKQDDVTSLSDASVGGLVLTTPRQDRQVGTGNSGLY